MESNRKPVIVVAVCALIAVLCPLTRAQYGGGAGEPNDPYLIYTAEQMNAIGADPNDWDKHFNLMADIDLGAWAGFNTIGNQGVPFSGVLDGSGKKISRLNCTTTDQNEVGLFGCVSGPDAQIRNLTLVDPNIRAAAGRNVGSLAGCLATGRIVNCRVIGGAIRGTENVGGLVGIQGAGAGPGGQPRRPVRSGASNDVIDCFFAGIVSGRRCVGGAIGTHDVGTITGCHAAGIVSGDDDVGGLVGYNTSRISDCYATGNVEGSVNTGGLAGINQRGTITNCYAVGYVTGGDPNVGGLVGYNSGSVFMSFWDIQTSGQTASAGGKGRTTAEMQTAQTFLGWGACGNDGVWRIEDGRDYPRLSWEDRPGQAIEAIRLSDFAAGAGTPDDPFVITDAEGLNAIGLFPCEWDKHFVLEADIDLGGYRGDQFNTIGNSLVRFTGVFDGKGHTIANFAYAARYGDAVGLFGQIYNKKATIRNLILVDPNVASVGALRTGALLGYLLDGTVENCAARGGKVVGDNHVGGLAGETWLGIITDCYTTADVTGTNGVGGLAGTNHGTIKDCCAECNATGTDGVGGLVGTNHGTIKGCCGKGNVTGRDSVGGLVGGSSGHIDNCHATGNIVGSTYVGGLLGGHYSRDLRDCYATGVVSGTEYVGGLIGYASGIVTTCYATGAVLGGDYSGGLVGYNSDVITNCYATGDTSGRDHVGGLAGGNYDYCGSIVYCYSTGRVNGTSHLGGLVAPTYEDGRVVVSFWDVETSQLTVSAGGQGKTTAEMQTAAVFLLWGACDNAGIWVIEEDRDYPRLAWEGQPGQPIAASSVSSFLPGSGTKDDPILISTAEELHALSFFPCDWGSHFRLVADIDLSSYTTTPFSIGTRKEPFRGVFDGDGHIISHFSSSPSRPDEESVPRFEYVQEENAVGLFKYVSDPNAEIRNVGLVEPRIDVQFEAAVGSLVGYLEEGTLVNCYVQGGSVTGENNVGGLVGHGDGVITECYATTTVNGVGYAGCLMGNNGGIVTNCHASGSVRSAAAGGLVGYNAHTLEECYAIGSVSALDEAGGLAGWNVGTIENCFSTGTVAHARNAGGLVSVNHDNIGLDQYAARIVNCYATGAVSGRDVVGGLVARNGRKSTFDFIGEISCCYSTGRVSSGKICGGLVGVQDGGSVEFSFWDTETSEWTVSAGGTGKTTAEMQDATVLAAEGWDFYGRADGPHDIWAMQPGEYPILWWQVSPAPPLPAFSSGTGEPDDPYGISTAAELNGIGHNPRLMKAHFVLLADIDLAEAPFFPIGSKLFPFAGVLDGDNKTILGLTHNPGQSDCVGLVAYVGGTNATIRNLGLIAPQVAVDAGNYVGSLIGYLGQGTVANCFMEGGAVTGTRMIGGLVGYNRNGVIRNCHSFGTVSGDIDIGGLVGYNGLSVDSCYASGDVLGQKRIGGLAGENWGGRITNCYSTATVSGDDSVGGLVALTHGVTMNCYAAGRVTGNTNVGGLLAKSYREAVSSFWDIETSGQATSDSGTGLTTVQMKTIDTFMGAGWDFVGETDNGTEDVWWVDQGQDYPRLWWEAQN